MGYWAFVKRKQGTLQHDSTPLTSRSVHRRVQGIFLIFELLALHN
ncbi:hypothetical protein COO91_01233 [Nostoc flagelliforme CCNUN1]|uniref:Uncharacterized protein n=1 Tax=Nostoc flagelliforme CCNUN1 TaxID=2038116 RepID=A0A2K8SKJ2_9NOSO|nr:hypothetical protein COO91_01233 [Nostoc flagelliforme CCNUN1]